MAPTVVGCTVRVREGQTCIVDGLCAETTEYLIGCNQIVAVDVEEAVLMTSSLPWARTGAIEIRPVHEIKLMRQQAGV